MRSGGAGSLARIAARTPGNQQVVAIVQMDHLAQIAEHLAENAAYRGVQRQHGGGDRHLGQLETLTTGGVHRFL